MCPSRAIEMKITSEGIYQPIVDEEKCTQCSICVSSCPGHAVEFRRLNQEFFQQQPTNDFVGNFLKCYVGHSNNDKTRFESSSGGLASEILIFALERGLIDGALVTRMKPNRPTEPEPFIARSREEILDASKHLNLESVLPVKYNVNQVVAQKA